MATLQQLKEELAREKGYALNEMELNKIGNERRQIEKEIKELRFKRKYGGAVSAGKSVVGGFKSAFSKLGTEVGKLQQNQINRERQEKAIKKRGFKQNKSPIGLFG